MNNLSQKESSMGFVMMLVWCIVYAAANVFTSAVVQSISPTLLCFSIFFCAILLFGVSRIKNYRQLFTKCKANIKNILLINLTTFCCWYFTIYPLKYIEPAIVDSIIVAVLPLATLTVGFFIYENKNTHYSDYITSTLLFIGIFLLAMVSFEQKSAIKYVSIDNVIFAFLGLIVGSAFLAINNIFAKKLSNNNFSPMDILAVRFILITIATGFLSHNSIHHLINIKYILDILLVAVSFVIIPQITFQYALKELEPITTAIIASLMPVLVFAFEYFNKADHLTVWTIMGVLYISIISITGTLLRYKKTVSI